MCILDVNECDHGTYDCNPELGSCQNTIGSFTCRCKPGFTGDGKNCLGTVIFIATTKCQSYDKITDASQPLFGKSNGKNKLSKFKI